MCKWSGRFVMLLHKRTLEFSQNGMKISEFMEFDKSLKHELEASI